MRDAQIRGDRFAATMLDWYDKNARDLAWRIGPSDLAAGQRPDPYRVWMSEVMLQQTTVAAVTGFFRRFTRRWPTVFDLAAAEDADVMGEWAGLGYYARARNLLKCARAVVSDHGGRFPEELDALLALPGIGPYTAAAISAIAFDRPETVLDGNVERVMTRLHDIRAPLPGSKPELKARATDLTPSARAGDYAQAVMDLGATICTPSSPTCGICPVRHFCAAHRAGTAAELPIRSPRKIKPTRRGIVYIGYCPDGSLLLERRPDHGLLGGMLGWPGSDWVMTPLDRPPCPADWTLVGGDVRHTFTHFHLILTVKTAQLPASSKTGTGFFVERDAFRSSQLPTVMRKAYNLWHAR